MKVLIQAANGRIQYPVPTLVGINCQHYFIVITTWSCLLSGIASKSIRSIIDYCATALSPWPVNWGGGIAFRAVAVHVPAIPTIDYQQRRRWLLAVACESAPLRSRVKSYSYASRSSLIQLLHFLHRYSVQAARSSLLVCYDLVLPSAKTA